MEYLTQMIIDGIAVWGCPVLVVALLVANLGLPLSSQYVLGFAGSLVGSGQMNFAAVVVASLIGELLGACLAYALGYYGGTSLLHKYGRLFGLSISRVNRSRQWLACYGAAAVFLGRLFPVMRGVIGLPAGFIQMNFSAFFLSTGFSSVIWIVVIVYTGQILGEHWRQVESSAQSIGRTVLILVLMAAAVYIGWRRKKTRG